MEDLTDEELGQVEQEFKDLLRVAPWEKIAKRSLHLIAEVRRHRVHKCEHGGTCGECGARTIPHRFCHECSQ